MISPASDTLVHFYRFSIASVSIFRTKCTMSVSNGLAQHSYVKVFIPTDSISVHMNSDDGIVTQTLLSS